MTFKWLPDEKAEKYLVQISDDNDFSNILVERTTDTPTISVDIDSGLFYVRVAGITEQFRGEWSETKELKNSEEEETVTTGMDIYTLANYNYYLGICYLYHGDDVKAKSFMDKALELYRNYRIPSVGVKYIIEIDGRDYEFCKPTDYILAPSIKLMIHGFEKRAKYYMSTGYPDRAARMYERLIQIDPYNLYAMYWISVDKRYSKNIQNESTNNNNYNYITPEKVDN